MGQQAHLSATQPGFEQKNNRLLSLDIARGVLILLVVFMHCYGHVEEVAPASPITRLWDFVVSASRPIRMPAFFLISGYLAKSIIKAEWKVLLWKRVYFLAYMYCIWLVLVESMWVIIRYLSGDPHSIPVLFATLVEKVFIPNSFLWFLWALAAYAVLAKLTYNLPRWITLGVALIASAVSESLPLPWAYLARCALFFLIGAFYPAVVSELLSRARWVTVGLLTIAYLLAVGLIISLGEKFPGVWLPATFFGSALVVMDAGLTGGWAILRPLAFLGTNTIQIYVMHFIVIKWVNYAVMHGFPSVRTFLQNNDLVLLVYPVLLVAFVVVVCLALHWLFMMAGLKWLFTPPGWNKAQFASAVPAPAR